MNDPAFKTAAYKIAEETPPHLGQPTSPPIHWVLDGANLRVLLADGRTVRAPIVDQKRDKVASAKKQVEAPVISSKGKPVFFAGETKPADLGPSIPAKADKPLPSPKPSSPKGKTR